MQANGHIRADRAGREVHRFEKTGQTEVWTNMGRDRINTGVTRVGNYTWCYRLSTGVGWGHHGRVKSGANTDKTGRQGDASGARGAGGQYKKQETGGYNVDRVVC